MEKQSVELGHGSGFAHESIWQVLKEDLRVNGSILRPGAQAMAMYRLGHWADQSRRSRFIPFFLSKIGSVLVRNLYGIELYRTSRIGRRVIIAHQNGIVIHEFCTIGDDCIIRQGVTIGAASDEEGVTRENAPIIGNRVQFGAGSMIVGKVTIGDDVRIGPNAVVSTDVPANSSVLAPRCKIISWA